MSPVERATALWLSVLARQTAMKGNCRPEECPRFNACGANVCPLDADWRKRVHLKGEPVCGLLLESVKSGGEARLRAYLQGEPVAEVLRQRMPISTRWGDIKRRLDRASQSGSKLEAAERMRASAS